MARLGIYIAGFNGAVASTLAAGIALVRRQQAEPLAIISEAYVQSHDLAPLDDIVVGGWDVRQEDQFTATLRHRVLEPARLQPIAKELAHLKALPVPRSVSAAARDLERFRKLHRLDRLVLLTLIPTGANAAAAFYGRVANETGSPFVNFTPNHCDEPKLTTIPYCGRDGKTGQTWLKSVIAPALHARGLRISGWYSTNLLGNEDGKVVGDPQKGKAKIRDKTKLLAEMVGYEPFHKVQINYYPPRGDNKESWDNIDFEGFLGMPMQIKINQLYRDSILAAPMCLDLARFIDLAQRRGETGSQEWLSYYFKSPYARQAKRRPPHAVHLQEQMLREYLQRG